MASLDLQQPVHLDAAIVDLQRRTVHAGGSVHTLSDYQVQLLTYFLRNAGQVVGREELAREVWGFAPGVQSNAVSMGVSRLRALIERDTSDPRHLLTVRGSGWIFVAPSPTVSGRKRSNVHRPTTPTLGRGAVVDRLVQLLASEEREIRVHGLSGAGKSRVVAEAALRHLDADTQAEVWVVNQPEGGVLDGLAGLLGVRRDAVLPELQRRRNLTVVVDPVDGREADVARLLHETPVQVVTVGVTHGLSGSALSIGPLAASEAAELFQQRATLVGASASPSAFDLGRLVEQLGRLPGPIEVAAARLRVLSVDELLANPVADHRRGMQLIIDALRPETRAHYLSWRWFSGPFSVTDAAELADRPLDVVEDQLRELLQQGLVHRDSGPLPLRIAAGGFARQTPEGRERYIEWACALARRLDKASESGTWQAVDAFAARREELVAAAAHASSQHEARIAWHLAGLDIIQGRAQNAVDGFPHVELSALEPQERRLATARFALAASVAHELELAELLLATLSAPLPPDAAQAQFRLRNWTSGDVLEHELDALLARDDLSASARAVMLLIGSGNARRCGVVALASRLALQALAVIDRWNVQRLRGAAWAMIGDLHNRAGDLDAAVTALRRALDESASDDVSPAPMVRMTLGNLLAGMRDPEADTHLSLAAAAFRRAGDYRQAAMSYAVLASHRTDLQRVVPAQEATSQALAMMRDDPSGHMDFSVCTMLALVCAARGEWRTASYYLDNARAAGRTTAVHRRHLADLSVIACETLALEPASTPFYPEVDAIHHLAMGVSTDTVASSVDAVKQRVSDEPSLDASDGLRLAIRAVLRADRVAPTAPGDSPHTDGALD